MAGKHPLTPTDGLIPSRGSERLIVRPDGSLHLDGRRSKAMVESRTGSYSASNAYFDGVNWQRYDTAQAAAAVWSDPVAGTLVLLTAAAGANPITWTTNTLSTITSVAAPLTLTAGVLDIQQASAALEGSMSAADYTLLHNQAVITSIASPLTLAAGVLDIQQASASLEGSLAAADYTALQLLANPPRARVYRSTNQAIATGTPTAVSFDTTRVNSAGASGGSVPWAVGNPTRLTVPTGGGGWYSIGGNMTYNSTAGGTSRNPLIKLNGTTFLDSFVIPNPAGGYNAGTSLHTLYQLAAGDFVEWFAFHDAGVSVNVLAGVAYSLEFWFQRECA